LCQTTASRIEYAAFLILFTSRKQTNKPKKKRQKEEKK